jgi:uncharacterized surface protein with fasciclin (FAS1) repeats
MLFKSNVAIAAAAILATAVTPAFAQCNDAAAAAPHLKRAALSHWQQEARTVVDIAVGSPVHTTLVAAVQAAGLADTLSGPGPFTVFAPTNEAFAALPAGTVETLLRPANRSRLQGVLTYHVVPGRVGAAELTRLIRRGRGHARLTTVAGGHLTARLRGGGIEITDAQGRRTRVARADLNAGNGVVHVTDGVFLPR